MRVELLINGKLQQAWTPEEDALLRMAELAEDAGVPDLSVNIDHYLYGHPKVGDAE